MDKSMAHYFLMTHGV